MFLDLSRDAMNALYAVHYLARRSTPVPAAEISRHGGIAPASLSKLLQRLRRQGVVRSERGHGFTLARSADEVTVLEVVRAIEGPVGPMGRCLMQNELCPYQAGCPLSRLCGELRNGVASAMQSVRFSDLPVGEDGLPVCMDAKER